MKTIIARKRKDGTTAHLAQLLLKRSGAAAAAWLEKREMELTAPGALERQGIADPRLADVIDRYFAERRMREAAREDSRCNPFYR
jgi:hypothetical protein